MVFAEFLLMRDYNSVFVAEDGLYTLTLTKCISGSDARDIREAERSSGGDGNSVSLWPVPAFLSFVVESQVQHNINQLHSSPRLTPQRSFMDK